MHVYHTNVVKVTYSLSKSYKQLFLLLINIDFFLLFSIFPIINQWVYLKMPEAFDRLNK